jgi:hypothetical protein
MRNRFLDLLFCYPSVSYPDPAFFVDPDPSQIRIRIQTESGSYSRTGFKPDLDWEKMLDPDLDSNESGSTTLFNSSVYGTVSDLSFDKLLFRVPYVYIINQVKLFLFPVQKTLVQAFLQ